MQTSGRVRFGGCVLDAVRGEVIAADGSCTVLRAKTLALLNLLLEHAGQLLSQDEILDRLWPDVTVAPASVTQCISELRQALGAADAEMLKTLPRRGYMLAAVPELEAAGSQALTLPARVAMSFESPLDRLAAPHDVPTVAVLQPRWLGPDPEDPWLAEGIAHDITEILTKVSRTGGDFQQFIPLGGPCQYGFFRGSPEALRALSGDQHYSRARP